MTPRPAQLQDLFITQLDQGRVSELLELQRVVCEHLERPELYFPVTAAEMADLVGPEGLCLGIEHHGRLVAFFGVLFMGDRPGNVGLDLGLPAEELPLVAYFMAVNVLPSYRGRGLQQILTHALFGVMGIAPQNCVGDAGSRILRNFFSTHAPAPLPSFQWQCSTVSPLNPASLNTFLSCGFRIAGLKPKYLGYLRYLLIRERNGFGGGGAQSTAVPLHDYERQADLLTRSMVGIRLDRTQGTPTVHYV